MIAPTDISGFFADRAVLAADEFIFLTYQLTLRGEIRQALATFCAEQSTTMWTCAEDPHDHRPRHAARVVAYRPLVDVPVHDDASAWEVVIAHPWRNFGARLPNLLVAVAGEGVWHAPCVDAVQLCEVEFPESFLARCRGPQFGVAGLRERMGIVDRPFFFGVVKPNLGLSPAAFAVRAAAAWRGGLDWAKDDEMFADTEWSPLVERARAVADARAALPPEDRAHTGYIANITDEAMAMPRHLTALQKAGAMPQAVLVNPMWTGISAITMVREQGDVPVMAHFAGTALLSRGATCAIDPAVVILLQRLAGADIIGMPGFGSRMHTTDAEVRRCIDACLRPLGGVRAALPVPGGGDWAGTLPAVVERIGHSDFGFIAGRGVFGHPSGPQAGAESVCQAWAAMQQRRTLAGYARDHESLAVALQTFGP